MITSVGLTGHAFPVIALGRELGARGNEVWIETSERWRDVVEGQGIEFVAAQEDIVAPGNDGEGEGPSLAQAAGSLVAPLRELRPEVLVSDLFTLAPALAAEAAGVRRASLLHHPYPVSVRGRPPFPLGLLPPRTSLGARTWRAMRPLLERRHRRGRRELNQVRAEVGLPPMERLHGAISEGLALVATFPQLEYPRRWPSHVHVTGPMLFEPPSPEVVPPEGDDPLVVVAASTAQDPELTLVGAALEALQDESVRVVATTSGRGAMWEGPVPGNAVVADWVSHSHVMADAAAVVCTGGHGTVARALADGVPVLVCPVGGDQPENGARVAWAGVGLMLPRPLLGPGPLRRAVRRLLVDPRFAARAREIAVWGRENSGSARGAELVEAYARP